MTDLNETAKNILVDVRVFPLNIFVFDDAEPVQNESVEFAIAKGRLSSFVFNDVFDFETSMSADKKSRLFPTNTTSPYHEKVIRPIFFNVRAMKMGCVVLHSFYDLIDNEALHDTNLIQEIDSAIFTCSNEDALMVKKFADSIVGLGLAEHSSVMKYDLLNEVTDDQFKEEMAWRAWSSLQCISFNGETDRNPWPSLRGLSDEKIDLSDGSIKLVAENLFSWWMPNSPVSAHSILGKLEPISYMMAKQSIIAGAVNNLKQVTQQFVLDSESLLRPEDIRKYDALIRHNIIKVDEYKSSTEKESRSIFRWACERNEISQSLEDLQAAHEPVTIAIENMDRETDQRVARRISAVILIFTSMTFLSVVADVVGLLDHRNQIFLFEERFTIFGGALALTAIAVIVVMASFFRRHR